MIVGTGRGAAWRVPLCLLAALQVQAAHAAAQAPMPLPAAIPAPADLPFPGVLTVRVDATDVQRRVLMVHETVPVSSAPDLILLLPEWLPGWHAPGGRASISRIAGLRCTVRGTDAPLPWQRDPVNMFAFHLEVPPDAKEVDVRYQYLSSPTSDLGPLAITPEQLELEWTALVLYPAGFYAQRIPVEARVTIPPHWHPATALERTGADAADADAPQAIEFRRTDLETLMDSPVFAGAHFSRIELDHGSSGAVHLDVFADRPQLLAATPAQIDAHRALVRQADKLFGARHFDHYDFLLSLTDRFEKNGLEHHRSSEDVSFATYFTEWDKMVDERDLLSHEYVHSWNGKFRRPSDLWTANFNEPMHNSLLWVYEGQTQYWGQVLSARSGLWTRQQALDEIALTAALYSAAPGGRWRPLQDTTNDEILSPRQFKQPWASWQRYEDYYMVGALIWLDADTLIRQKSGGRRSLDDFARAFFGMDDGRVVPLTYTFDDVVAALERVQPYDWRSFLRQRLDSLGDRPPLDGVVRGGYRLSFDETPGEVYLSHETRLKVTDLTFSLGLSVDKDGKVQEVLWDGPAYRAGLAPGSILMAVNGVAFEPELLKEAVTAARGASAPLELIVRTDDRFRVLRVDYHGGLRYPHLTRDSQQAALLDDILAPRN